MQQLETIFRFLEMRHVSWQFGVHWLYFLKIWLRVTMEDYGSYFLCIYQDLLST